jgi:hypothetical protein
VTEETGQTPWIRERDTVVERTLAGGGRPQFGHSSLYSNRAQPSHACALWVSILVIPCRVS